MGTNQDAHLLNRLTPSANVPCLFSGHLSFRHVWVLDVAGESVSEGEEW